jgi:rod shape determining protein RodA
MPHSLLHHWWSTVLGNRVRLSLINWGWLVVLASLGLSVLGLYAIDVGERSAVHEGAVWAGLGPTVIKQLVYLAAGVLAAVMVALPHYRLIGLLSWPAMLGVLALLVFLLIPVVPESIVTPRNGTRGWINLGVADFQPSELAKVGFVLVCARYLRFRKNHRTFVGLLPPALIAFVPMSLIMLQPDLGTALLFIPPLFAMLLAAGARIKHLTLVVLLAMLAAPASYPLLKPYQKARIMGLVQQVQGDTQSAADSNYQSYTAQTLMGAGGAAGQPDERARALIRFNRLPERHNDMIISVVVHRFGLMGGLEAMGLYVLWIGGALLTAATTKDPFGRLIAVGLAVFIAGQTIVNIGMNVGVLPIVGVPLPFVSAGGSSMLSVWLMTGLLVSVGMRRPRPPFRPSFEYADADDF